MTLNLLILATVLAWILGTIYIWLRMFNVIKKPIRIGKIVLDIFDWLEDAWDAIENYAPVVFNVCFYLAGFIIGCMWLGPAMTIIIALLLFIWLFPRKYES